MVRLLKAKPNGGVQDKRAKMERRICFNIKLPPAKKIQIPAWDVNLVTPHKWMGNSEIILESICDGNLHEVLVELDGIGGGGKVQLEIRYKGFEEVEEEKKWWSFPSTSDFLQRNEIKSVLRNLVDSVAIESILKNLVDSEAVPARQFVEYAFGQLKSLHDAPVKNIELLNNNMEGSEGEENSNDYSPAVGMLSDKASSEDSLGQQHSTDMDSSGKVSKDKYGDGDCRINEREGGRESGSIQSEDNFWDNIPT